ncbi:MAG: DUF4129 domain-containing protein [Acidimicrobiaceae bacterium]|nr:DUF4129 domain-containing protein [Acidimicrobiaceae bacterium]
MRELPPSEVSAEEARDVADQVLSGRAYVEAARPPSLQERAFDWIADLIGDLFNALSSTGGRGIIAWVVIIGFGLLIAFLVTRLMRNLDPLPAPPASARPIVEITESRSAGDWLADAIAAERNHDWRTAIRCRHRSLVAELLDLEIVTARPGLTAGEIAHEVAQARPAAAATMHEATWLFKDTWYGSHHADAAATAAFADLAHQVIAAAEHEAVLVRSA